MAEHAQKLIETNKRGNVIQVIAGKIEEIELPEKVDIIISEPMGKFWKILRKKKKIKINDDQLNMFHPLRVHAVQRTNARNLSTCKEMVEARR